MVQHDRGGLVERRAQAGVATLRDPADDVPLVGLAPFRRRPHPGADILGSPEALGIVDRGPEGERDDVADAGRGHQEAAHRVLAGELAAQRLAGAQDRLGRGFEHRVAGDQLADAGVVAALGDRTDPETEVAQQAAQ